MKLPKPIYRAAALITIALSVIGFVMSPVSAAAAFSPQGDPAGTPAGTFTPHHMFNSTQQAARLQTVLTNLSQQGVDVSQAQADLTAGNVKAAMQWLMTYRQDHPGSAATGSGKHAFNSTQQAARLQSEVMKLASQGVDVSEVQADLTAGNVTAAMQWMAAYHQAHPVQNANRTAWHGGSSTAGSSQPHTAGSGDQAGSHRWFHRPGHRTPAQNA